MMSLKTRLNHAYGIKIQALQPRKGAFQASLQNGSTLCVKPMQMPRQEVKFVARVLTHLRDDGYSYSPKLLYTKDSKLWARRHEVRYLTTNWIDGRSPDFNDVSQLRRAVRMLARFHKHAKGLKMTHVPESRKLITRLGAHIQTSKEFILQRVTAEQAKPFVELCEISGSFLNNPYTQRAIQHEKRARAFVHGDFNYHNIVIDAHGRYQLIDFDKTALQARMYDLAHLMYRVCPWDGDAASRLIEVYDHIRPIRREDLCLLVTLRCVPGSFIRSIHWGGKLDIPSRNQMKQHIRWMRRTVG